MSRYINKISNRETENFLKQNNYTLANNLINDEGNPIPAIERDEESIFVRAIKQQANSEFENLSFISNKIMLIPLLISTYNSFNNNIDLIYFSDYDVSKLSDTIFNDEKDSQNLFEQFIEFMRQKFPTYENDCYNYYKQSKSEPEKEQNG